MRWILIAPLAAMSLCAQTPAPEPESPPAVQVKPETAAPPSTQQQERLDALKERLKEALKQRLEETPEGRPRKMTITLNERGKMALAPSQRCAIPLKNVLPEAAAKADEKMIIPVPQDGPVKLHIKEISPPAPSCDDVKR